jgi:hypothetical protein
MAKVYYEDILIGEVETNRNISIPDALDKIQFDAESFMEENNLDEMDWNVFSLKR